MSRKARGFDYRAQSDIELPMADWKLQVDAVVQAGGFRRAEKGETFAHDAAGVLQFEVYAIVPERAPRKARVESIEDLL